MTEHHTAPRAETGVTKSPVTLGVSLKLYLDIDSSVRWAEAVADVARANAAVMVGDVRLFVLPSLAALSRVAEAISDTPIALGAQDLFWEDRGAYTGGVSGADLVALGCRYVEVGHAERRTAFGEDSEIIRRKFAAAVRNGLTPVLCVGERDERGAASAAETCIAQLESAVAAVDEGAVTDLVVAYEPEWAIGRSTPAAPEHVVAVIERLRIRIDQIPGLVSSTVIYGGSAKLGLLSLIGSHVDGLFLGRFAHDPVSLNRILDEAALLCKTRSVV